MVHQKRYFKGLKEKRPLPKTHKWLVGQAVKTPASHAGNAGSIPARVTKIVGVDDAEGPPVPIPNTEVKLSGAEDTWLATAWEDRKTPTLCIPFGVFCYIFLHSSVGRAHDC